MRVILGAPDYQAYLERFTPTPAHAVPLSEQEFYLQRLSDRYESGQINRCC
jgi:uncharacterized short protein YbdD (DUF466 family)